MTDDDGYSAFGWTTWGLVILAAYPVPATFLLGRTPTEMEFLLWITTIMLAAAVIHIDAMYGQHITELRNRLEQVENDE